MKTKGAIWDEYTIVEFKDDGKTPKTVQCKHPGCDYRVSCHPFLFWATLHVDSCIAPLGKLLASIPASQASVERVFSTADWLATNWERLGFRKLARDTFIRYNHEALSKR